MGRRRRADGTRTGRGRTFIARRSGRSRGAGTLRWTACFTAQRRPTETYVGDPEHCREMDDSPDDPGVANALA